MRKLFLIATALISFTACNPLDKSITEELTVEEIKTAIDKDSLFDSTYKMIEIFKKANEDDKLAVAKYSELTYQGLLNYSKYLNDKEFWDAETLKHNDEWRNIYLKSYNEGKDLIKDWKRKKKAFEKENDPAQYVKIELVGISTDYYEYSGGVEDVYFKFRITPLKGKLDQVVWAINPTAKINGEPDKSSTSYILDRQGYIYSRPLSGATVGRYEASYDHRDLAAGKSAKSFMRDYFLNLELRKVRYKGKNYELDGFDMPWNVEQYIKYDEQDDDKDGMKGYYMEKIVREIDSTFIDKESFALAKNKDIRKEAYPLEFEFSDNYFQLITSQNGQTDLLKNLQDLFKK